MPGVTFEKKFSDIYFLSTRGDLQRGSSDKFDADHPSTVKSQCGSNEKPASQNVEVQLCDGHKQQRGDRVYPDIPRLQEDARTKATASGHSRDSNFCDIVRVIFD